MHPTDEKVHKRQITNPVADKAGDYPLLLYPEGLQDSDLRVFHSVWNVRAAYQKCEREPTVEFVLIANFLQDVWQLRED